MGYVHIIRPDGTEIYLGLDSELPADVIMTCDSCNVPKPSSQGHSEVVVEGVAEMWLCEKCRTVNYG